MEVGRQRDLDYYWKSRFSSLTREKFDHLWTFLPEDISSLLDVGGGGGALFDSLKAHRSATSYHLVEFSREALAQARGRGLIGTSHDIDQAPLPFPDDTFDCVVGSDLLEHLRNPWAVLAEMGRVSKKYVFLYGPNFASLSSRLQLLFGRPIGQMSADRYGAMVDAEGCHVDHITFVTYKSVIYWARKLGLEVKKSRAFWYRRYAPFRWFLEPFFKNFGRVYEILCVKERPLRRLEDPNFLFPHARD